MAGVTTEINNFNKNKWICRFSNMVDFTDLELDTTVLDNYIRTVNIPDLSVNMLTSEFQHERQLHPDPRGARDLQTINMEFKMDEEGKNFYYFWCWLMSMRAGKPIGKKTALGEKLLRMDCIDAIEVCLLNNDKVMVSKMKFLHCIPTNLSALSLETGQAQEATFIVTFDYENMTLQPVTSEE